MRGEPRACGTLAGPEADDHGAVSNHRRLGRSDHRSRNLDHVAALRRRQIAFKTHSERVWVLAGWHAPSPAAEPIRNRCRQLEMRDASGCYS
jgi:hypothetical protein